MFRSKVVSCSLTCTSFEVGVHIAPFFILEEELADYLFILNDEFADAWIVLDVEFADDGLILEASHDSQQFPCRGTMTWVET